MRGERKLRIRALVQLLDDPDAHVYRCIEEELLKERSSIIPDLEEAWELASDEVCQLRIEQLIGRIRLRETFRQVASWSRHPEPDLLEGFILASRYHNPDLNEKRIRRIVEEIWKKIWIELNNSLTSIEKITVVNHVLFNDYGFRVTPGEQSHPRYCFLGQLLEERLGNPTSIALFYNIIARKAGLPVKYVDLPRNPLLAYIDRKVAAKVHPPEVNTDVLFYINPANKGSITGRRELEYLLRKMHIEMTPSILEASSSLRLLVRLLEISEQSFARNGQEEKVAGISEMIHLLSHKKRQGRN